MFDSFWLQREMHPTVSRRLCIQHAGHVPSADIWRPAQVRQPYAPGDAHGFKSFTEKVDLLCRDGLYVQRALEAARSARSVQLHSTCKAMLKAMLKAITQSLCKSRIWHDWITAINIWHKKFQVPGKDFKVPAWVWPKPPMSFIMSLKS